MFDTLFPIIVPRSYNRHGNWVGPLRHLVHPELAVTWVELGSTSTPYVSFERHSQVEKAGVDVHAVAMQNLRKASPRFATHEKVVEGRTLFQSAMQEDGLGSSRLLLLPEMRAEFPGGFRLAIPDRSCAVLVPKYIAPDEHDAALAMIASCFEGATTPMLPGLFESTDFELEAID